jgi:hypothetical protein
MTKERIYLYDSTLRDGAQNILTVIPAKAGISLSASSNVDIEIPAYAGMTKKRRGSNG